MADPDSPSTAGPDDQAGAPPAEDAAPAALSNPWWIPPFLGRIPVGIEPGHLQVLAFVAFAMLFENYDLGLIGAALPQIAADFGLSDVGKGYFMSAIDMGALPSLLLVPLADRIGRRRVLLIAIIGMSLGSALTAFSPNATVFALFQIITRTFATGASVVSFVIVAEEFPAAHRGWGIGMLGAIGAVGFGIGALVYAQVDWLPYGWRSIYLLGGFAVFLLPVFRSRIRETSRYEAAAAARGTETVRTRLWRRAIQPLMDLVREHPRRALMLGLLAAVSTAGHRPAFRFISDFLQTTHGWTPGQYATMTIVGGTFGLVGSPLAGRLGDRFGRRRLGAAMLLPFPLLAWVFYQGPEVTIIPAWIAMVFIALASGVVVRSLSTELFPTSSRSAGGAWTLFVETLGASGGLFLYAGLESGIGQMGLSLAIVSTAAAVSTVFLLYLPDTHQRELESIHDAPR